MSPVRILTRRVLRNSQRAATAKTSISYTNSPGRHISQTSNPSGISNSSIPPTSSHTHATQPSSFQKIFAAPTWSVRTLLPTNPSDSSQQDTTTITSKTLHHLLRLSSLPTPTNPAEESSLLHTLHTQLHFVRAIQAVDTTGVAPLTSIRDESSTAVVTLDHLKEALAAETTVGFRGRPRRVRDSGRERGAEEVMVEEKTRGRREKGYYVVESGKVKGGE